MWGRCGEGAGSMWWSGEEDVAKWWGGCRYGEGAGEGVVSGGEMWQSGREGVGMGKGMGMMWEGCRGGCGKGKVTYTYQDIPLVLGLINTLLE